MPRAEPAIHAALEAAGLALRRPWPAFSTRGMTAEQQRQRAHEMAAAATIAAFLRALPDQYSRGGASFWDAIPAVEETRLWLATAVERASKEPPHA